MSSSVAVGDSSRAGNEDDTEKKKKKRTADEAELDILINDTLQKMNTRREEASIRDEERLDFERKRAKREEKSVALDEQEQKQRILSSLWVEYERASSSTNASMNRRAQRLKQQIADLEGIPIEEL